MARTVVTIEDIKERLAHNLSERRVKEGDGPAGILTIARRRAVTRTFRAHWTGFKIFYPESVVLLRADLEDGSYWSEGYISVPHPSWVLAFRKAPPKARGSGGPRPDDKLSHPQHVEKSLEERRVMIEAGLAEDEELIRMEDYDDPIEAVDGFFNYTSFYMLKSSETSWDQIGYKPDPSIEWARDEQILASLPIDAAIDEGLKKSDIIWVTPNTVPGKAIPCWFVYKDGKAYVLSGERQQVIPGAERVRDAHVVTRRKMRDARLVDFDAAVRQLAAQDEEFEEIADLFFNKRQSVTGSREDTIKRWRRECVILELTPRV